ncbi:MAG: DUF4097 family beta strand repeat-containing protein [Candidatus Faecenecus gallistercoris]|nr:DUF4097 family beta strand repeat-containing protein [Bacillota bacterium]MDY4051307.1 DUF4097 family beta strand repeat-containing protein [Candidatus Faecenecus gallistercoris]
MTSAQRVIKAIAIGFAIFLIVLIFSSILIGLSMVGHIFGLYHDVSKELTVVLETDYAVSNLEIDVSTADLELVLGSRLMVSSTDSNVRAYIENGTLYVEEDGFDWFDTTNDQVIVQVPTEYLDFVCIDAGAGKVSLSSLKFSKLDLSLGAGNVSLRSVIVTDEVEMDGGAGKVTIEDASFHNFSYDGGVGEFEFTGTLVGFNDLDSGIGTMTLHLNDSEEEYTFILSTGIGSVSLNQKECSSGTYGTGPTNVQVDGGIGSIAIETM